MKELNNRHTRSIDTHSLKHHGHDPDYYEIHEDTELMGMYGSVGAWSHLPNRFHWCVPGVYTACPNMSFLESSLSHVSTTTLFLSLLCPRSGINGSRSYYKVKLFWFYMTFFILTRNPVSQYKLPPTVCLNYADSVFCLPLSLAAGQTCFSRSVLAS